MNEGFTGFLAGFYTYYARVTLYGFLTVYTMDYINTRSKRRAGLDPVYMWVNVLKTRNFIFIIYYD